MRCPRSLFEWLIVVAVASCLGAVAAPTFVSQCGGITLGFRSNRKMSSLATALTAYRIDHGAYPPYVLGNHPDSVFADTEVYRYIPGLARSDGPASGGASGLTTPVSYILELPADPCSFSDPPATFAYISDEDGFYLISPGPDGDFDIPFFPFSGRYQRAQFLEWVPYLYDPTNGIESGGDVLRTEYDSIGVISGVGLDYIPEDSREGFAEMFGDRPVNPEEGSDAEQGRSLLP